MKVKILFFAKLKDVFGSDIRGMEVPEGTTVSDLEKKLFSGEKCLENLPLLYAVNENYVSGDHKLSEKDTVAFLPPVAGG